MPVDRFISLATGIERQMKKYEKNETERRKEKEKEKENVVPSRRPSEEIAADGEGDGVRDK